MVSAEKLREVYMEEIVERISNCEFAVLVISVSSACKYNRYASSVDILVETCPTLHVVLFSEDSAGATENSAERILTITYGDEKGSLELERWLGAASILILVNMSLSMSSGNLSPNSSQIAANITRNDLSTYCVHPTEMIDSITTGTSAQSETHDMHTLRQLLQDASVLHMVPTRRVWHKVSITFDMYSDRRASTSPPSDVMECVFSV